MYNYIKNYKDIVTDDCTLVIDFDQIAYIAAASAETRSIRVIFKDTKEEKLFKTRDEFWGRSKNKIGGFLAKLNEERVENNLPVYTKEDFEIFDIQTVEPEANCYHNIKMKITGIFNHLDIHNYICVLSGKNNFRLQLPAPQRYKANREDMIRPVLLPNAIDYVKRKYDAIFIDDLEADDYISMLGYQGYVNYKKTGKFNYIVVSIDKDQFGVPSLIFNMYKEPSSIEYKHTYPILVDNGIGDVWLEANSLKGYGIKFTAYQMLCGDDSDNVRPAKDFYVKFGDKSAFKLIDPLQTQKEIWDMVYSQYLKWFPDGVKFTGWDGKEYNFTTLEWADNIFNMIYMKHIEKDGTTFSKLLKHYKIIG